MNSNVEKREWTKEEIVALLDAKDAAVLRGLVVIYSLQTAEEKFAKETVESNGVGFSGYDAQFLSSLAQQVMDKGLLSQKQLASARKRIRKYAGQLTLVANGKLHVQIVT